MNNPSKIFDGVLVLEYRAGSKKALGVLVQKYHLKLCKHACYYTHDLEAAKDVVQDSWSIILRKLHTLKEPNQFGSWAYRIVTRKALNFVNQSRYKTANFNQNTDVIEMNEPKVKADEQIEKLNSAILFLPKNQQIVLGLFYTEGYSLFEIAGILEIAVGTVKSRLFHAREKLKTNLKSKL